MIPQEIVENALHVSLLVDKNSFAQGSALYTFMLMQHKKVTLVAKEALPHYFIFLPWYDKVRKNIPSSSDFTYEVQDSSYILYQFFQQHSYKINKKMAEALYAGLFLEYDCFRSKKVDGTVFALANELITLGANHQQCREYLFNSLALSSIRVNAILSKNLLLQENGISAVISISSQELVSCGATLETCMEWMDTYMRLVHVKKVILVKSDENDKIIKILKDI